MGGEERRLLPSRFEKRYAACPGPRPGSRWPAGARPARGSRTSAAWLRTGGEEESARTGDSNRGCNCLVRGYSPSMHFFCGGDMPHYSPPLPFRGPVRAGQPAGRPARGSRSCALCGVPRPAPRVAAEYVRAGFQFLDRYISLARKIGYVTIKPMTNTARYLCFSWLMCNRREKAAWPAITVLRFEKNRSSGNVQKGQNFGLALNIGPAFSDRFHVLTAI